MIKITCPNCGKNLEAPEEAAGGEGRCSVCSTVFSIPRISMPKRQENKTNDKAEGRGLLISCKACRQAFSDYLEICPHCGKNRYEKPTLEERARAKSETRKMCKYVLLALGIPMLLIMLGTIWDAQIKAGRSHEKKEARSTQGMHESTFQTHIDTGRDYLQRKQYNRAIAEFNKAIELRPKDAMGYLNRGVSYHKRGSHRNAIRDYERVLELYDQGLTEEEWAVFATLQIISLRQKR